MGCGADLTQRVCPLFFPSLLSSQGTKQDPCSQEHWPLLACACPAFWSWVDCLPCFLAVTLSLLSSKSTFLPRVTFL